MTMNEARLKVLEMLEEGKITAHEASILLKQIPDEQPKGRPRVHIHSDDMDNMVDLSFLSGLGDTITNAVGDAMEAIGDAGNISFGFGARGPRETTEYTSNPIAGEIPSIKLMGKNASVEVKGWDGNHVKFKVKYSPKGDARAMISEEGGNFEVLYDYNAMRWLGIDCYVPHTLVGYLHAESKNAKVEVKNIRANNAVLITKNAKAEVQDVICPTITIKTRNAGIEADRVQATQLDFTTSNARIELDTVTARTARLTTSNAKVETDRIDIAKLYIKTSNGSIKLDNVFDSLMGAGDSLGAGTVPIDPQYANSHPAPDAELHTSSATTERIIEASTSNSSISITIPPEVAVKLQASTSNARVDWKMPNVIVDEISKNYINGRTHDYDTRPKRAKISLNTSNGTIKVRE